MSTIEIGLTVAVVVLFVALLAVWRMAYVSRVDCADLMTRAIFARDELNALHKRKPEGVSPLDPQILELSDCVMDHKRHIDRLTGQLGNHKGELAMFIKLANGSEQKRDERLAAVEATVASLRGWLTDSTTEQVSDPESVALELERDPAFHDPVFIEQDEAVQATNERFGSLSGEAA